MPDKDLKLNSVSRYSKQSPRLILEEYSHCEVPAGCGGVVLRWRNPDRDVPLTIHIFTDTEERQIFMDGTGLQRARSILPFGEHLLALRLENIDPKHGVLLFLASYDEINEKYPRAPKLSRKTNVSFHIGSSADGTWKYATADPGSDWATLNYDDPAWAPMIAKEMRKPEGDKGARRYRLRQFEGKDVEPLGINENVTSIWIRKRFTLQKPGARE